MIFPLLLVLLHGICEYPTRATRKYKKDTLIYLGYNLVWDTLQFKGTPLLVYFIDFDWVIDPDHRNSTASYVFNLGSRPVSWACKKQQAIALSSIEANYCIIVYISQESM